MSVTLLCCYEGGSRLTKQQCCRLQCFLQILVKFCCFQDDDTDGHTDTENRGQEVK